MRSSCIWAFACVAFLGLAPACGSSEIDGEQTELEQSGVGVEAEQRPEDGVASDTLAELALRHAGALPAGTAASLRFEPELAGWAARKGSGTRAWSASFPELADEPVAIEDAASGLAFRVRAQGAASVVGGQAGDFVVYPSAYGRGSTLLYRVREHGFED